VANARSGKRVREIPQPGLKRTAWGVGCGEVLGRWKWARRRGRCRVAAACDECCRAFSCELFSESPQCKGTLSRQRLKGLRIWEGSLSCFVR